MNHTVHFLGRRLSPKLLRALLVVSVVLLLALVSAAQDVSTTANSTPLDRYEKKTFVEYNGTLEVTSTLETEHHVTSDGEVEIQRYRAPAWEGDQRLSWEREVRTRKLPDGTVEKEYVIRNPDGAGQMAPVGMIREKIIPRADSTVVQTEVLGRLGDAENWQPVQKEQTIEKGPENARRVFKEVQRLDTATREWQTFVQETSLTSTSTVGDTTQTETKSVTKTSDGFGFADFEHRQVRAVSTSGGNEYQESTVYRRDTSTTEPDHFFLLDHTTTKVTVAPGNTTRHLVRESDLLFGNYEWNMDSPYPEVVEEQTTVEKTAPDGSRQTVTRVSGRTPAEPSAVRPVNTIVEDTDSAGYVRRIYIPAQ